MCSSVGLVDIGGGGGKQVRSGGGGGGGGKGKRRVVLIGVGDGRVGTLGIERAAERWWDNVRVLSSSSVSEWEASNGESVGEGSCGLGRNQ